MSCNWCHRVKGTVSGIQQKWTLQWWLQAYVLPPLCYLLLPVTAPVNHYYQPAANLHISRVTCVVFHIVVHLFNTLVYLNLLEENKPVILPYCLFVCFCPISNFVSLDQFARNLMWMLNDQKLPPNAMLQNSLQSVTRTRRTQRIWVGNNTSIRVF